jgi:acyl carrier protein
MDKHTDKVTASIFAFIRDNFLFGLTDESLSEDTSFLESGIIDSTGLLELVNFVEQAYNIRLNDDDLIPANLDSVRKLREFIGRKTLIAEPELSL